MVRVVLRFIYIYIRCVYICIYTWMNASPCTLSRERCGQGSFGVLEAGLNKVLEYKVAIIYNRVCSEGEA